MLPLDFYVAIMLETQSVGSSTWLMSCLCIRQSNSTFSFSFNTTGSRLGGITVGATFGQSQDGLFIHLSSSPNISE